MLATNRFCTNCGSPLDEGAVFCTACGASVEYGASPSDVAGQGAAGQASAQAAAQPASQAVASAPVQGAVQSSSATNGRRVILILAIVAVVAIIAVLVFLLANCSGSDEPGEPAAISSGATSSSSSSVTADDEDLSSVQENAIGVYERIGALDERISACANEFNANCLKPDRALRERCAQTAKEVLQDAYGLQTTISAMSSGGAHQLGEYTGNLRELGNDLTMRIQVIDEAWSRSLEFSDPAAHESYIFAPIVADSDGSDNKYYRHFKDNYPNWNPANS